MTSAESNRYIAFSGGGWHTHTASSAWMSGALEALQNQRESSVNFNDLLGDLNGAAGNSGGSWFLSMLTYSEKFQKDLANNAGNWFETGYMGQLKEKFNRASTHDGREQMVMGMTHEIINTFLNYYPGINELAAEGRLPTSIRNQLIEKLAPYVKPKMSDLFTLIDKDYLINFASYANKDSKPDWGEVTRQLVYSPYDMYKDLSRSFGDSPNAWASDGQDIIFGAAIPTNGAIVDSGKLDSGNFISANLSNKKVANESDISPVTILYEKDAYNNGNSFVEILGSDLALSYVQTNSGSERKESIETSINNSRLDSDLSIVDATTISSAAAGMLATLSTVRQALPIYLEQLKASKLTDIVQISLDGAPPSTADILTPYVTRYLNSLSIPVSLKDGASVKVPAAEADVNQLARDKINRLIDGGYVDNTAVANIVNSLQERFAPEEEFSITLFSNSAGGSSNIPTSTSDINVTSDVANLFGEPNFNGSKTRAASALGMEITTVTPHIFNKRAWLDKVKPDWSFEYGGDNKKLEYYQLDVETIDNDAFDVVAGYKGKLNVFININTDSDSLPSNPNILDEYENMFNNTRKGILEGDGINGPGSSFLLDALGLTMLESTEGPDELLGFDSDDKLKGLDGNDILEGKSGSDILSGGDGDDIIIGGNQNDTLKGGDGKDIFKYQDIADSKIGKSNRDVITDFSGSEGDKIDLSDVDDNLRFIGSDEFSEDDGEVRFHDKKLIANIKGNQDPEMEIKLEGVTSFTGEYLIL